MPAMAAAKYELPCDEHTVLSQTRARRQTGRRLLSIRFGLFVAISIVFAYGYHILTECPIVKLASGLGTTGSNDEGGLDDTAQAASLLDKRQIYTYNTSHATKPHTQVTGATYNYNNAAVETSTEWAVVTITHTPSGGGNMSTPSSTSALFANTTSALGEADTTVFVTATVFPQQPTGTGMFSSSSSSSSVPLSTGAAEADTTVFVTATVFPEPVPVSTTSISSSSSAPPTVTSSEDSGADVTMTITATVIPEFPTDTSLVHSGLGSSSSSSSPCAEEMSSVTAITTSSVPVWTTSTLTSKLTWSLTLSGLANNTTCHETASDVLHAVTASATIDPRSESAPVSFVSSVDAITASALTTTEVASVVTLTVTQTPVPTTTHMTITVTNVTSSTTSSLSSSSSSSSPAETQTYSHTTTSTTKHLTSVIATTTLVGTETATSGADDGFTAVAVALSLTEEQCASGPVYTQITTILVTSTVIFVTGPTALAPTATETVTVTAPAGHPGLSSTIYSSPPEMTDTTTTTTCTNTGMATITVTASGALASSDITTILAETVASTDAVAGSASSPASSLPMVSSSTSTPPPPPNSGFSIAPFTPLPTITIPLSTAPTLIPSSPSFTISGIQNNNSTASFTIPALSSSSSLYTYTYPSLSTATTSVVVISGAGTNNKVPRIPTTYWGSSNGCSSAACVVMLIAAAVVGLCNVMV